MRFRLSRAFSLLLLLLVGGAALCCALPGGAAGAPGAAPITERAAPDRPASDRRRGGGGAVASAEGAASDVGRRILEAGGDAADAAVAVALALAVVHPQAGNLGGGGFAVVRFGEEIAALDFRETAPAAARRDMFRGPGGEPVPKASLVGPLAAGVPGSPAGLFELHRRYGRLPWAEVVAPAVELARSGFTVSPRLEMAIQVEKDDLSLYPETAAVWLPHGEPLRAGTILRLPELAATLAAYAARGPDAITSGPIAAAIESASVRHGGILTAADLAAYRPIWREPVRFRAFGWEVAAAPLPASGGIIVGQTLLILERLGWPALPARGADRTHLLVEAWRRAYADRYLLGDPATSRATAIDLLDPVWIARRAAGIESTRATSSAAVRPWPDGAARESSETAHLSVADGDGNLVSLTTTLNGWFGCYLQVPGAGFLLNNEMDDFTTVPDRGNLFELVQGEANAVRPGARMLSSFAPLVAWRAGEAVALGSRGGSRIPTAVSQVLLNLIVDHDTLRDAVERPRVHHQWRPDELRAEAGALDAEAAAELQRRGHTLSPARIIGEVNAVRVGRDGAAEAAGDPRGPSVAALAARSRTGSGAGP